MWSFPKAGHEHSNSSSKLNEFFNDQDASTALVREAVQNSLDAALTKEEPVTVRFSLATHPWSSLEPFLQTNDTDHSVDNHLSSADLGKFSFSFIGKDLRCLIIEDEGTKGLIGDTDKNNALSGSNFVGFWWNDGISRKTRGSSGSHGVGKTTLTRISGMSLFLAVTKRSDDEKRFLLGFANLPYHRVNGDSYIGYGRYGRTEVDERGRRFLPIEDQKHVDRFLSAFSMERDKTGLSVFIPGIPSTVDNRELILATVRDYYWPILRGNLIVEVADRNTGQKTTLNAAAIDEVVAYLEHYDERSKKGVFETKHRVEISKEILQLRKGGSPNFFSGNKPILNNTTSGDIRGEVTRECFSDENIDRMRNAYDNGELVGFSFSLALETNEGEKQTGLVEAYIKKTNVKQLENAQFIRNQIIISKQPSGIPAKDVTCFLIAEDQDMSEYLKEAEEPAHTRWFLNRFNEQRNFKSDWALRLVMDLPSQLFRILTREDEEDSTYENFADDIFSIPEPSDADGSKKPQRKPSRTDRPAPPPPSKRQPPIRIERNMNPPGFEILPVGNLEALFEEEGISFPIEITVKAAYVSALGKTRSWKDYSKIDFDFGKTIPIEVSPPEAAKIVRAAKNSFTVELLSPNFRISANGFDRNRDLLIHPKVRL